MITRDAFGTPVAVDADGDDTTANVRAQMWGPSLSDAPVAGVDGSGDGVMTVAIDGIAVGRLEGGAFVASSQATRRPPRRRRALRRP